MTAGWLGPTLVYIFATGAVGVMSKLALRDVTWHVLIMWSGIGYVLVGVFMLTTGATQFVFADGSGWAALSAVAAISSLFALFVALTNGEAGAVVPVSASYPVVTLMLAAIFLSESITITKAGGAVLVIGGVVMLTMARSDAAASAVNDPDAKKPGLATWLVPTMVFAVAVGGLGVTSKLALKHLVWEDLILLTSIGYTFVCIALIGKGIARPSLGRGTFWAVMCAVAAIGGLIMLYVALSTGEASKVVPVSAAYPAVTLVLSALLLGERLTVPRSAGVVLVIGGVVLVTAI